MRKNSIGELKLSPIKEDGKFVFFNDFITINGKVSKGDKIKLFVERYELKNGKYCIDATLSASVTMTVRGQFQTHEGLTGHQTIDELYDHVAELYKENFYFGHKV